MRWLALCLVLVAGDAFGAYLTGNTLLERCKEHEKVMEGRGGSSAHVGQCLGYLQAAHDTYEIWREWGHISRNVYCMPEGVKVGQLLRIVVKYLEAHPEDLHLQAGSLVLNAYSGAFPCE